MAMIICTECGKEFSDRAAACPNCGCPIEFIKADIEKKKQEESDVIVARYDILGELFEVNERLDRYIRINCGIQGFRKRFLEDASMCYYNLKNIDGVIEEFPEFAAKILDLMLDAAIEMLKSYEIYEFDKERFYLKYSDIFNITEIMEPVIIKYLEILDCEDEIINYHNFIHQVRRNSWVGGGFGVQGALKGYFKAQMLNMGETFIHTIPDAQKKSSDIGKIEKAKSDLYRNETTRKSIIDALLKIYDATMEAVLNELTQAGKIVDILFDESKAVAIINNLVQSINEGNYEKDFIRKMCLQAFKEDPLYYPTFEVILDLNLPAFYSLSNKGDLKSFKQYLVDYGFMSIYKKHEKQRLEEKYSKELSEITDMIDISIASNTELKVVLEKCKKLRDNGVDVDDLLEKAVTNRLQFPLSSKNADEILKTLKDEKGLFWCGLEVAKSVQEKLKVIDKDETDIEKIAEIVRYTCLKASNKINSKELVFENNIKSLEHYKEYAEYANVPIDAKIYMVYATWNHSNNYPRKVIMLTDTGLYAHFDGSFEVIIRNWRDFAENRLFNIYEGIKTGGYILEVFMEKDVIFSILNEIRSNLRCYFGMEDLPNKDERLSEKIQSKCEEYSKKFHAPIHRFGNKKNIQKESLYYCIAEGLSLPEQIDIYYAYYSVYNTDYMKRGLVIADQGIFWKSFGESNSYLTWNEFKSKNIILDGKDYLYIGKDAFYAPGESKFIFTLLKDIQSILVKKNEFNEDGAFQSEKDVTREQEAYWRTEMNSVTEELSEKAKKQIADVSKQINEGRVKAKRMISPFLNNAKKSIGNFWNDMQNSTNTEKCPKCGTIVGQKDNFCTTCGEKLDNKRNL